MGINDDGATQSKRGGGAKKDDDKGKQPTGQRDQSKKKATKACLHCQKAHLTCDDSRPCQRCVKKGMADMCVDGQRKKAKYLMDEEEKARAREAAKRSTADHVATEAGHLHSSPVVTATAPVTSTVQRIPSSSALPTAIPPNQLTSLQPLDQSGVPTYSHDMMVLPDSFPQGTDFLHDTDPIFNLNFDPAYQFDSHAANQEYTMLSSIFADSGGDINTPTALSNPGLSQPLFQLDPSWPDENNAMLIEGTDGRPPDPFPSIGGPTASRNGTNTEDRFGSGSSVITGDGGNLPRNPFTDARHRPTSSAAGEPESSQLSSMTPSQVYQQVTKPYPYTEGYHFLMRYLTQNFEQADIFKVVKALASFRPSLIALQMPLTVEDEVFLEKSFQRTLIELEKLISYNGTPTAVWRRTGEICLAGEEFCRLTEFSKHDLLSKKTFIYELFEKQSVVDYFEKFSQYAFENTTQNFFWQCVLVTASGKQLPCSGSFTIRRDVFDLPSVIIGQLLPITS